MISFSDHKGVWSLKKTVALCFTELVVLAVAATGLSQPEWSDLITSSVCSSSLGTYFETQFGQIELNIYQFREISFN